MAKIYSYTSICIDFSSIDYGKLLEQNKSRASYKFVPEEVIKGMCENLESSKQWFIDTFKDNYYDYYKYYSNHAGVDALKDIGIDMFCYNFEKKYLDNGIVSYNFTRDAFYKQKWNELTCKARGLFIDSETGKIVTRSYDKFFNEDQLTEEQLHKFEPPFDVSYKENGYLGLLSYNPKTDDFFIATKSVDYGDYKDWFKQILEDKKYLTNELKQYLKENNVTFVFEVIDPEHDSHIIEYDEKQVYLLDIIRNEFEFKPYSYDELYKVTSKFVIHRKYMYYIECDCDINYVLRQLKDNDYKIEGYVIRDKNNKMVKVKLPYYKFWKKVRSYLYNIINYRLNFEDIDKLNESDEMKNILKYAFDNYYSDISLIAFRKEYENRE